MRFTCCCSSTGFLHKKKVNNPLLQHLYRTFVEKVQKNLQITILFVPLHSLLKGKHIGELAEWSNAAVLKTVDLNGSGGSNPSLSALKSLQVIEFQSCRLFLCPKSCTKNAPTTVSTHFYGCFSNPIYPTVSILLFSFFHLLIQTNLHMQPPFWWLFFLRQKYYRRFQFRLSSILYP